MTRHYASAVREGGPACGQPQARDAQHTTDLSRVTCKACRRSAPYQVAAGTLTQADLLLPPGSVAVHWHPRPGDPSACRHVHGAASITVFEQAGRLTTDRTLATCGICTRTKDRSTITP